MVLRNTILRESAGVIHIKILLLILLMKSERLLLGENAEGECSTD